MNTSSTPVASPRGWQRYGLLWKQVPRTGAYLLVSFPLAIASLVTLVALVGVGISTLVLVLGLPVIWLGLWAAHGFAVAQSWLLRITGQPEFHVPAGTLGVAERRGVWARLIGKVREPRAWTAVAHGVVVSPIISTISFVSAVVLLSVVLGGLSYGVWSLFGIPSDSEWGSEVIRAAPWLFAGWAPTSVQVLLAAVAAVGGALVLPSVFAALAGVQRRIARAMLGPWKSEDLGAEAQAETAARVAALQAEDTGLRRLERDIHDGPQQRLVRIQLDLGALERRAEAGDLAAVVPLAAEARAHVDAALGELRALSTGIAPPLLQDRGLAAAVEALGLVSTIPVRIEISPEVNESLPPEVARATYFMIAELLTNAEKHSAATRVDLHVAIASASDHAPVLRIVVSDDGHGGADYLRGHGLDGLRQRIHGLRGDLALQSPGGGPTRIEARVPLNPGSPRT